MSVASAKMANGFGIVRALREPEAEGASTTAEVGPAALAVPDELPPALRQFAEQLRDAVQAALAARDDQLRERERELQQLALALGRAEATSTAQLDTFAETRRRLELSNRQLAQAIEERDRKLVVFSRKLDQVRIEARDAETRRRAERRRAHELLAELETLGWTRRARRREIHRELAAL